MCVRFLPCCVCVWVCTLVLGLHGAEYVQRPWEKGIFVSAYAYVPWNQNNSGVLFTVKPSASLLSSVGT